MKIISIGDIHGRNTWKLSLFGSLQGFTDWQLEHKEGISEFMSDQYPYSQYDKIIFIGDYVDSFTVSNGDMKRNLEEIVLVKSAMPDRVILLLGNHDVQYVTNRFCSGYRAEMAYDLREIFTQNRELFQIAYLHQNETTKRKTLWTHAGVAQPWLDTAKSEVLDETYRFREFFTQANEMPLDEFLNQLWEFEVTALFDVDSDAGGRAPISGPLWIRPRRLQLNAIEGYDQVVGHTPQEAIVVLSTAKITNPDSIYLIDCLEHGSGQTLVKEY